MNSGIYKICITGGICSGKSTITKFLGNQANSTYMNLDSFTEVIYRRNPFVLNTIISKLRGLITTEEIEKVLPSSTLTKGFESKELFNRKELGKLCFSNKKILEIVQTVMRKEILELEKLTLFKITKSNLDKPISDRIKYVFIESPTVIESGNQNRYDELWSVIANKNIIEERFKQRLATQNINEYEPSILEKIMANQASNQVRISYSKVIIDTNDELSINLEKAKLEYIKLLTRLT